MLKNENNSKRSSSIQEETVIPVKKIVCNGIPVTITVDEQLTSTRISLQGHHKQWDFTVLELHELTALGHIGNIPNTQAVRGETTALATIGMKQLQDYADRRQRRLSYVFNTENPAMITWYNHGGNAVLGTDRGTETDAHIMKRREFRPTKI